MVPHGALLCPTSRLVITGNFCEYVEVSSGGLAVVAMVSGVLSGEKYSSSRNLLAANFESGTCVLVCL